MRRIAFLIGLLMSGASMAADLEDRHEFKGAEGQTVLRVLSSTDTDNFAPIITAFLDRNPDIIIDYAVASSASIDALIRDCGSCFDVVISSAMDLQLKSANDGLAMPLSGHSHPDWAHWRSSLFGFTLEPATIVLNRAAFEGRPTPETRQDLIEALRAEPEYFRTRIGTYDVRDSGLGYLFATQDARASETYWRLMEVFGSLDAGLYCCSGDMIDDLAAGTIYVAYNVLGSYASSRPDMGDQILVITPEDFATTMMRTVWVSRETGVPGPSANFVAYLLSANWRDPARPDYPLPALIDPGQPVLGVIDLDPGLLVHLDRLKRKLFLSEWISAVVR